jgi:hypothetical protein
MRVMNVALIILLLSLPAMAEERDGRKYRKQREKANEARREGANTEDRIREQTIKELKKFDEERKKAMEKASLEMIKGLFKKAKEADKDESWARAYSHYHDVSSSRLYRAKEMIAKSKARMSEIDGVAKDGIRQARMKEYSRQYPDAVAMYQTVIKDFGFSQHAAEAKRRIAFLLRSNSIAPGLILAEADTLEKAKNYPAAQSRYKHLTVRYPRSVEAITARKKLEQFNRDIAITEAVDAALAREAQEKGPGMLRMAENFLKNRMPSRARYYLDMIIRKYPKTEWADKARAKLETLE